MNATTTLVLLNQPVHFERPVTVCERPIVTGIDLSSLDTMAERFNMTSIVRETRELEAYTHSERDINAAPRRASSVSRAVEAVSVVVEAHYAPITDTLLACTVWVLGIATGIIWMVH